ncbi:cobalamin adenosyltransferase [Vallitalea okinawensis]|uniref:cobalamin adenosyltransferase n=1 Tax=Vallitalea okinawensis TaxID=2078660 RepID=UPI000CFA8221|nr:cobalamin adenosyltransferase [Vallitalea okinawensis]
MRVLTETTLRGEFRSSIPEKFSVSRETIITPSAKQYLNEKGVMLVFEEDNQEQQERVLTRQKEGNVYKPIETPDNKIVPKYLDYYTGGAYEEKPEYMTHIYGNRLVYKDDSRIVFRGKLDSYQSRILETMVYTDSQGLQGLTKDLNEVLEFVRKILKAEVLDEPLKDMKIFGLDEKELREMSHNPKKHFGILHIMPSFDMGETLIRLNSLRSAIREVEISGIQTFKKHHVVDRQDILQALNRLSSVIYIMMCRERAGKY